MGSRPCLLKPIRYKSGRTNPLVPPAVYNYLQLLPKVSVPFLSDSKSRGSNAVRVRPPPPAPFFIKQLLASWYSQKGRFCRPCKQTACLVDYTVHATCLPSSANVRHRSDELIAQPNEINAYCYRLISFLFIRYKSYI